MDKYKNEGYPIKNDLVQSGFIIRNHSDKECIDIANLWWNNLYSKRDQMSFNYVCWKYGFIPNYIDPQIIDSEYIEYWTHKDNYSRKVSIN